MAAQWVSIATYAETHSVHVDTVYKWMQAGLVETFRIGRLIRVQNIPPRDKRPQRVIHNQPSSPMLADPARPRPITPSTH